MAYQWNGGPVHNRKVDDRRLFYVGFDEGRTVVRNDDGTWQQIDPFSVDAYVESFSASLRGGRTYDVSDAHAAELIASGFGDYLVEV